MNSGMYYASSSSCASQDWPMLYLSTVAVLAGFGLLINLIALWVVVNVDQLPKAWALPMALLPWVGLVVALAASVALGLEAANQGESPWSFLLAGAGAHLGALVVVVALIRSAARRAGRDDTPERGAAKPDARAGDTRRSGAKPVRGDAVGITAEEAPEHGGRRRDSSSEAHQRPSAPPYPRASATGRAAHTRSPRLARRVAGPGDPSAGRRGIRDPAAAEGREVL
ncbi:hypothetical protein ACIO8G_36315 [Streptomyces sp. NPDC087219]|uniref:hypothetical protein n=1 Tax=Streptomyces sp. NPDC087219 TaxID=3365770 RepID=UPI00381E2D8D